MAISISTPPPHSAHCALGFTVVTGGGVVLDFTVMIDGGVVVHFTVVTGCGVVVAGIAVVLKAATLGMTVPGGRFVRLIATI